MKSSGPLTVLYDGRSGFHGRTSRILKRLDRSHRRLLMTNTAMRKFEPQLYDRPVSELKVGFHVRLPDDTWHHGPEAFRQACSAVGLWPLVLPTRLPILKQLCDAGYQMLSIFSSPRAASPSSSRREYVVSKSTLTQPDSMV